MSIVAAFDKTLFYNEASKYCVLRLKTADLMVPEDARSTYKFSDHLIRFVAVGYDLPQTDSIKMELEGIWSNGKYGCQLQVERWHEIVPPTIEGIRGYLTPGLLKGIGPKTAEAIIQRFGIQSLYVLEHQPEKLLEIRGITEERLEEIKNGYATSKAMRDLMTLLAPFKVTPTTAMKIYEHLGSNGVELLRKSPFRLCQISGFGFKRVDAIVQKSGGDLHDPMRVQGALFYTLEKSRTEGGHLYMEAETLVKEALLLLNEKIPQLDLRLERQQVEQELKAMIMTDVMVANKGNIYLPHVFTQESETACKVVQMLLERPEPVRLAPVMEQIKSRLGIKLSPKQSEGVEMVFRHNLSIITGGPGTGKSTVLKAVIAAYRQLYPRNTILLGAPTGKASRRMAETTSMTKAQTLHSLLKLHGEDAGWQKPEDLEADFLIVDECSMMDMWLAYQMFSRLKAGTKVLLVGDADQLESVGAGSVFRELIQCGLVPVTVLDQLFRQARDSLIAHNAKLIKDGKCELYYGRDFSFVQADSQEEAAELIRTTYRKELEHTSVRQVQILTPFRSEGAASANGLNEAIRDEINPAEPGKPEITFGGKLFRLHDQVMQVKNDSDIILHNENNEPVSRGVFNGEAGMISAIRSSTVTVNFDGRFADYSLAHLGDLDLSYATTIHKAQGSEYEVVIIPMLPAHKILLSRNLFYTGITRAKRRVILVGHKKALYMAIGKSSNGRRNTLLGERITLYQRALTHKAVPAALDGETKLKDAS
ncbi:ATP-dependent RecD-like DNA helicase [Pseudoflavonifractor sp. 60]|uniref:SF1B family DNA helicase RecD2 n=1 Tax=Pseudoflavonifractor sp. 60 TaxID=2304576 RepID=UPI00136BD920|nr:ATP-dependent RecD-like DNA helicase [Pseudoflavonifractor sp. 60]NBI66573.1 ATP-dependent RecD-like DNA helicase [Pseudoflavonifractor sp. 60]